MNVAEKLAALRTMMAQKGIDAYLVPTDDFHGSEYVGDYFKCRKYLTGFTGSAGTALVTKEIAALWTDGRYFLQAARQLEGTEIALQRMGEEGVPTVKEYLEEHLTSGQALAFDGRTMSAMEGEELAQALFAHGASVRYEEDLVGDIWTDRPPLPCRPAWEIDEAYTGQSRADKLAMVRAEMKKAGCNVHILTSLDDIAWLLNIRGDDVECNPVVLSYLIMTDDTTTLYAQEKAIGDALREALASDGVMLLPYEQFYQAVDTTIASGSRVLISLRKINYTLYCLLKKRAELIDQDNPTYLAKAVKNGTEMANIRLAHVKDGVAMTRFIYWLKHHPAQETVTELSAADKLETFRQEQEHYLGPSFTPIIGYGAHASIIHYGASEETNVPLENRGMVLCDTGGQYLEGTTDITRTVVLGELTDEEKEMFTRVLRGHLSLANAQFKEGVSGANLDYLARIPLWEIGLDYRHGTGHGVGYCLNVHEGPNSINWKSTPSRRADTPLEEGMLTSDEPGYYQDNAYGIRHENLMLTRKAQKTAFGQFMCFETVTLVPFDLEGVVPELLGEEGRRALNAYHRKVYEALSPYLQGEELAYLTETTRQI